MAASTSAAHSNINQWYGVFINHRGVDVKKTFAKSLYNRLRSIGLTAFLDEDELQRGWEFPAQIENAIRTASAHVAILSARYAESNWCLRELSLMLESHRVKKVPIIPVFYGVTPAEVRWTLAKKGKYAEALESLVNKRTREGKPRYEFNNIENWRNALSEVADISGFELNDRDIGDEVEVELLDEVVQCLSEMLKKPDLPVADYPVGLDGKLKDFEETGLLLHQQNKKPQILGIVGTGGIGKTTFAKHFFNSKQADYQKSCFLFDVRDNAARGSLTSLQTNLLKSLTGLEETIYSVDAGKGMLIQPLNTYNALIVLDDVDDADQVTELLPVHRLCPGSLLLITSRDRDVLRALKVEESSIYALDSLNQQNSLELFCLYAFSQSYPARGFESLVNEFLKDCKGLPLSLKVFGALLYGRCISDWEDELGSLRQIIPTKIHKTFIISYNSLNKQEQQIFLDIACYFIGQDRDTAIRIWDISGWRGRRGFQTLQNKCLVEVDGLNRIQMHDHIRDLRIDVAEYWEPHRFWRWTQNAADKLILCEKAVRGIRMVHGGSTGQAEDHVFGVVDPENVRLQSIFNGLRILDTENALLEHFFRRVELPNLIWLRWKKCPHSSLPSWVSIKNLRILQVSGRKLNTLWHREDEPQGSQLPARLEELPLCLEELWANRCVELKSIQGLAQLTKLRVLSISGCSKLKELPNMETLVSLEELDVSGCLELKELAVPLVSLKHLWTKNCLQLKSIRGLGKATKLLRLHVCMCPELEELPSIETLVSLKELCADGCVKLNRILGLEQATKLEMLSVRGCSELEELPSMETLRCLEELWANRCVKLNRIMGLEQATKLVRLHVCMCSQLEDLPTMETLTFLEELCVKECAKLNNIRGLERATQLRILRISGCFELKELSNMKTLKFLEELPAVRCVKLKSIRGLEQATKLRCLTISGCSELEELPSVETLGCLEVLQAHSCVKLNRIRGLEHATKLLDLHLSNCIQLEELPIMKTLVSLKALCVNGCVKLKSIRGLEQLTKLRILAVRGCTQLEEVEGLEHMSLETLDVFECPRLQCQVWD